MRRLTLLLTAGIAALAPIVLAQSTGPYKVLKTAKVGGEGGTDYLYADTVGRRLYITRGATQAREATATTPAVPAFEKRLTIFDLDTLEPVGVIPGVGGNGATVCPKTGHGFTSDHPQPSMFDVKTMKLIKTIEVPQGFSADGIYCDTSNDRVYIGSHPTKSLMVVDAKDGTVLGNVDLGGTPEQTVADGKGIVYQVLQDRPGGVAVVDVKTMKVTKTYPLGDNGGCNGLAIDREESDPLRGVQRRRPGPANRRTAAGARSQRQAAADVRHPEREGREDPREAAARRRFRRRSVQSGDDGSVQHARQRHDDHRQGEEPDEFRGGAGPEDVAIERRAHDRVRQQDGTSLRDGIGNRAAAASSSGGDASAARRPRRWPRRRDPGLLHDHHGRQIGAAIARKPRGECISEASGQARRSRPRRARTSR